jgi:hypothetical protein
MRRLLGWIAFSSLTNVVVFTVSPRDSVAAYEWALDLLPIYTFEILWITVAIGAILILTDHINPAVRFFVLAAYGVIQLVFAVALLRLAWSQGGETAVVGALQWIGYAYFSAMSVVDWPPRPMKQAVK